MKKAIVCLCAVVTAGLSCLGYNNLIGITPPTKNFDKEGGTGGIITSGSGSWSATASAGWIHVQLSSGMAGESVGYTVDANDEVESREGVVYVEGRQHRITQAGLGANLNSVRAVFEASGGEGSVKVAAPAGKTWHARSNVSWISVGRSVGTGSQALTFTVQAYGEVSTRSGTLTIADNTFTVEQTGRRMVLKDYSAVTDFVGEEIKIRVTALADTEWAAESSAPWAEIKSGASGTGGGTVTVKILRNENANSRSAVITVGTEQFAITQYGTTNLKLQLVGEKEVSVAQPGFARTGVNVEATDGLAWRVASDKDWIEVASGSGSGVGNGCIYYGVRANPTLYERRGVITVTAERPGVAAKRIEITQAAAVAVLTLDGYEFEAGEDSVDVGVSVPVGVAWQIVNGSQWLTISGSTAREGEGEVHISAAANTSVKPRACEIKIADHVFAVTQKGRGVAVSYESKVFNIDGQPMDGSRENTITVTADADVSWTAEASDKMMLVLYGDKEGHGNGVVKYIVTQYVGDGTIRTGTITIGDKVVYVSQRPYELSIEPNGREVNGNSGEGEIQVALDFDGAWNAFTTEPWVYIYTPDGIGSGKIFYRYAENNTGKERTAKVVVSGEIYTLRQEARRNLAIGAEVSGHGGNVSGGGTYGVGDDVKLVAQAQDGYRFDHWVMPGGGTSTDAELSFAAVDAGVYQAVFEPVVPQLRAKSSSLAGVMLEWTNLAWATQYRVARGTSVTRENATVIATLQNDGVCTYLDSTGVLNQSYWYWVEAVGADDDVWSNGWSAKREKKTCAITYVNLRGTTHSNRSTYLEGETVTLTAPTARRGYTFLGWSPTGITSSMTGDVEVRAMWLQNSYKVRFDGNDGKGTTGEETFAYGFWRCLDEMKVVRNGYEFKGWSTTAHGDVEYADKESVKNLSASLNNVVTLYAVWKALIGIEGDAGAVVSGNDWDGYVIRPSAGVTDVVARVPSGVDAGKVLIELGSDVVSVLPKGARIKIMRGAHDITGFLTMPSADGSGRIDLTKATVKPEIVKEPLDPEKGGVFNVVNGMPLLTTAPTRPGLAYTLREGYKLNKMVNGDSMIGDGNPWTPQIRAKGGKSGFYSISVSRDPKPAISIVP